MKCSICGKEMERPGADSTCSDKCFREKFWRGKVLLYDTGKCVVIDGFCYFIGREDEAGPKQFRGFGGRKFTIKKNDGTIITTTNLSSNGTVPDKYREMLPDNAEFVDPTKM